MNVLREPDAERIGALLAAGTLFWVDLTDPSEADLHRAGDALGIMPFALEDSIEMGQRPKLDLYAETALWVFYGSTEREPVEVHLHLGETWVLTVRPASLALPDVDASGTRERLLYGILDALTDSFLPCVDELEAEVDDLQTALLDRPTALDRRRLLQRRGEILRLRQRAVAQRDLLDDPLRVLTHLPGIDEHRKGWVRDVHDQLVQVVEALDRQEAALDSALQLHLAFVAARQNEVVERLTVVSMIFLPLSVLTGFFGMNFGWLVGHIDPLWAFLVYGLGGGALAVLGLTVYVRRLRGVD